MKNWFNTSDIVLIAIFIGLGTIEKDYTSQFLVLFLIGSSIVWLSLRIIKPNLFWKLLTVFLHGWVTIMFLVDNRPKGEPYVSYTPDALVFMLSFYFFFAFIVFILFMVYLLPRLYRRYIKKHEVFNRVKNELEELDKS